MKKYAILLLSALALNGCVFGGVSKKPTHAPKPASDTVAQPPAPDISFGGSTNGVGIGNAESPGSVYTNKKFGFELWYPAAMQINEAEDSGLATIMITPTRPSASNVTISIRAERNPKNAFSSLDGKLTVLNDTLMKRLPADENDPQKTNVYVFEKNGVRVMISLAPGTSQEKFLFPEIIQSFKFTE